MNSPSEPTLADVLQELRGLRQDVSELKQDVDGLKRDVDDLKQDVDDLKREVDGLKQELNAEVKRWDERYYQLSKDTLGFARYVIVSGVIVAILAPVLRFGLEQFLIAFRS
ncbi:gp58-like family protein [Synechococcus sp. C9]|jgi:FtsZ-binding cell division protein ZapB|uniref:coiled-coil domain-containing protein n=1 Tax=Synechococcus sp. C9 TaxID=102119 RepID=UPI001FF57037|nr:gp58-like family protein [Synechococcus sp. C9]